MTCRCVFLQRQSTLDNVCKHLWTALLGENFHSSPECHSWFDFKRNALNVLWRTARNNVLVNIGRPASENRGPQATSVVNSYAVTITKPTQKFPSKSLKSCLNIKPSRVDLTAPIYRIPNCIPEGPSRLSFLVLSRSKLIGLASQALKVEARNFRNVHSVKREIMINQIVLLQTDKSGSFGLLPRKSFQEKVESALSTLFSLFEDDIKKRNNYICSILEEAGFGEVSEWLLGITRNTFMVKLFLKNHGRIKGDLPVRMVISERKSWQGALSLFLQMCLAQLVKAKNKTKEN